MQIGLGNSLVLIHQSVSANYHKKSLDQMQSEYTRRSYQERARYHHDRAVELLTELTKKENGKEA